jgi:hypothetical protein
MQTRMFRFPCSYLIYSESFAKLPAEMKSYVYSRLLDVLTGGDDSQPFQHLSADDRTAILGILRDTLPDLPAEWLVSER